MHSFRFDAQNTFYKRKFGTLLNYIFYFERHHEGYETELMWIRIFANHISYKHINLIIYKTVKLNKKISNF
jgi:hypothetical protein